MRTCLKRPGPIKTLNARFDNGAQQPFLYAERPPHGPLPYAFVSHRTDDANRNRKYIGRGK